MSFTRGDDFAGHHDGVTADEDADALPILWSVAAMIAHTLNNLSVDPDMPCDPKSCAPCDGLYRMYDQGVLDKFLRPYVLSSGPTWDWWSGDDALTGGVNWAWVTAHSYPGAHEDDGE